MDTSRTALIFIYCLLFITIKSTASVEQTTSPKPAPGSPITTNSPGGSTKEPKVGSTLASPATQNPSGKSALASPATQNATEKPASASPTTSLPGKSAPSASPPQKSASPTTQKPAEGSSMSPKVGGSASGSNATQTLPGGSASKTATTVDPKTAQPAKMSSSTEKPESGKSDDNITNETGQKRGSVGDLSSTPKPDTPNNKKYLWILLPVGVAALAVAMYFRYKFFKVHHHPETTDNGTENASFQRTESNRDGVTLLGVKSSGTEEGAAA